MFGFWARCIFTINGRGNLIGFLIKLRRTLVFVIGGMVILVNIFLKLLSFVKNFLLFLHIARYYKTLRRIFDILYRFLIKILSTITILILN